MIRILILYLFVVVLSFVECQDLTNDRPIIGILAEEVPEHIYGNIPNYYKSYVAASYVKYVEGAGARAVPIL